MADYGWDDGWAARLAERNDDAVPARVVRHDGVALTVAGAEGIETLTLGTRLDPEPTVGDWVAVVDGMPVAVLPRTSLLRRKAALSDTEQALAANVDTVLLVCGLDRPVKAGRIHRGAALASDAGAAPVVVLTKAAVVDDVQPVVDRVRKKNPGLPVLITSVNEGVGLDELRALVHGHSVALVGESGAGKSSIVNALLGENAAAEGDVRAGDAKGRHTTTNRALYLLPGGGTLVDSPGIRSIGLWGDTKSVTDSFADIAELADGCRFVDCGHASEPDCAVKAAVTEGTLAADRLAAWRELEAEARRRR